MMCEPRQDDGAAEVGVAGAGPVGVFLAARLAGMGIRTLVMERRIAPPEQSMAIGLMPPSLRRFEAIALADALIAAGCPVRRAIVHDGCDDLGQLDFSGLPQPFNFILSLPQSRLLRLLWTYLETSASAQFLRGTELGGFQQTSERSITLFLRDTETGARWRIM